MASAIMVIMITQIKCSAFTRIFWPFYSVLIRNIIKCRGNVATVFISDPVLTMFVVTETLTMVIVKMKLI